MEEGSPQQQQPTPLGPSASMPAATCSTPEQPNKATAAAAASMQTPSISVGKTVVRPKTNERGTVVAVDPAAGTANVDWGGSAARMKPVSLASLLAPPIPSEADVRLPTAAGHPVLINGGEHAHKQGTIPSFNMCVGWAASRRTVQLLQTALLVPSCAAALSCAVLCCSPELCSAVLQP